MKSFQIQGYRISQKKYRVNESKDFGKVRYEQTNVQVSEDSDVDFVPFDTHAISVSGWKGRVGATVTTYLLKWDTILELNVGC
jgi:hypothetical protein